jgi:hypothetical protein
MNVVWLCLFHHTDAGGLVWVLVRFRFGPTRTNAALDKIRALGMMPELWPVGIEGLRKVCTPPLFRQKVGGGQNAACAFYPYSTP